MENLQLIRAKTGNEELIHNMKYQSFFIAKICGVWYNIRGRTD